MQPASAIFEEGSDRYFFAIRPTPEALVAIEDASPAPRAGESAVPNHRRHMTMFMLGDFDGPPEPLLSNAMSAAGSIKVPAFHVILDRLRCGENSILIAPGEMPPGLRAFRLRLRDAMGMVKIRPPVWWHSNPHLTLMYGRRHGIEQAIDPAVWRVEEFLLIHSFVGESRHDVIGRWPLA